MPVSPTRQQLQLEWRSVVVRAGLVAPHGARIAEAKQRSGGHVVESGVPRAPRPPDT
jgi:hypothetical protein